MVVPAVLVALVANITIDRNGSPRAAGGLSTIPRDLARVGMLVRDGGMGIKEISTRLEIGVGSVYGALRAA